MTESNLRHRRPVRSTEAPCLRGSDFRLKHRQKWQVQVRRAGAKALLQILPAWECQKFCVRGPCDGWLRVSELTLNSQFADGWKAVTELNGKLAHGGGPFNSPPPSQAGILDGEIKQLQRRVVVGKAAAGLDDLAQADGAAPRPRWWCRSSCGCQARTRRTERRAPRRGARPGRSPDSACPIRPRTPRAGRSAMSAFSAR